MNIHAVDQASMRKRDNPWNEFIIYCISSLSIFFVLLIFYRIFTKRLHFEMIDSLDSQKITLERE